MDAVGLVEQALRLLDALLGSAQHGLRILDASDARVDLALQGLFLVHRVLVDAVVLRTTVLGLLLGRLVVVLGGFDRLAEREELLLGALDRILGVGRDRLDVDARGLDRGGLLRYLVLEVEDRREGGTRVLLHRLELVLHLAQALLRAVERAVRGCDGLLAAAVGLLDLRLRVLHGAARVAEDAARIIGALARGVDERLVGPEHLLVLALERGEAVAQLVALRREGLDGVRRLGHHALGILKLRGLLVDDAREARLDVETVLQRLAVRLERRLHLPQQRLGVGMLARCGGDILERREALRHRRGRRARGTGGSPARLGERLLHGRSSVPDASLATLRCGQVARRVIVRAVSVVEDIRYVVDCAGVVGFIAGGVLETVVFCLEFVSHGTLLLENRPSAPLYDSTQDEFATNMKEWVYRWWFLVGLSRLGESYPGE